MEKKSSKPIKEQAPLDGSSESSQESTRTVDLRLGAERKKEQSIATLAGEVEAMLANRKERVDEVVAKMESGYKVSSEQIAASVEKEVSEEIKVAKRSSKKNSSKKG